MTATQGDLLRDQAIAQVEANADEAWLTAAKWALWDLVQAGLPFTSDDCWRALDAAGIGKPREPRALGTVLRSAAKQGLIRATGDYVQSERPENHRRPVARWAPVRRGA